MPKLYFYDTWLDKWRAFAGEAAIEPALICGGSDEYSRIGVKVAGGDTCGRVLA